VETAEGLGETASSRSEVFDVTGAGDTVVAAFTLARLAGAGYPEAACLANVAGGLSVRRYGAAPVEPDELCAAVDG
jgi:bifunctional ADP-heptose synthase (sugar kinase/adenylyltransferase)